MQVSKPAHMLDKVQLLTAIGGKSFITDLAIRTTGLKEFSAKV
jgi:hypothetical protein